MHFNTKYIFKGDNKKEIVEKINYNFDQILSFGIGPDGHPGPIGATGIFGPAGRRGQTGDTGTRASNWYKQPTNPNSSLGVNTNDIWIDNSVSDGNIKVFNYPLANGEWNDSGYTFLNSKYFKSYSYILGPGGASDKYAIGLKNTGGVTGPSDISLIINDSSISSSINPNNSKVLVSTADQTDRPIMAFSKNGAISTDVPSFYWSSVGNNAGLKFDSGGSFYINTNLDISIDSELARTIISSGGSNFRSNLGDFSISGDGDFYFSGNTSVGVGSSLNVTSSNLVIDDVSFNNRTGGVTITSPLTSTYILTSSPSSPSYLGGISAVVKSDVDKAFQFNDYTGNPVLHAKPLGSVSSGDFAQTVFGSTGGLTGGTGGPFSYHVKKVTEVRQPNTGLSARKYLTTITTNLVNVFDLSSNTNWISDNIIATPTTYGSSSGGDAINSYKIGQLDSNFNYSSPLNIYGSGFKHGLSGFDASNAVVNDMAYITTDDSTIFVGSFRYYNEQPIKNGTLNLATTLGICKINSDGSINTTFRTNISALSVVTVSTINGILYKDTGIYSTSRIYIYGSFTYNSNKSGIMCLNLDGVIDSTFTTNMGVGFNGGAVINKAIFDTSDSTIVAIGNFNSYKGITRNKIVKIYYGATTPGSYNATFAGGSGCGFIGSLNIPYCLDIIPVGYQGAGHIIVGGTFTSYYSSALVIKYAYNIIELSASTGTVAANAGFTNMSYTPNISTDPAVSAIKFNPTDGKIYIGGTFSTINNLPYSRFARFTTTGTTFLFDSVFNIGSGFNDLITDFIFETIGDSGRIYVGGRFSTYRGSTVNGFVRINLDGSIDATASLTHNVVSPGTIQPIYQYSLGLIKKMYLDVGNDKFMYVGGCLNTAITSSGSGGGIYLKVPSSISPDYIPVYTEETVTNYRVFLNDIGNDPKLRYIRGIVFDAGLRNDGLSNPVTSYVDFSATGVTGCQYVDLMWASKASTSNLIPRLFYKTCIGVSGYVDFGPNGVYSIAGSLTPNTSQNVSVTWSMTKDQTGGANIYKNGTATANVVKSIYSSGSGSLSYSIGDKIYVSVSSGSQSGYIGTNASVLITKTSLTTGLATTEFTKSTSDESGGVNNFSLPVTLLSGYAYSIVFKIQSRSTGSSVGCFVGNTKITMSDGSTKNIEDVVAGDLILTSDPVTSLTVVSPVTSIQSPIKDDIIEFILSNGTRINATTSHPFWVIDKGWCSYSPNVTKIDHMMSVDKIEINDILLDVNGNQVALLDMNNDNNEFTRVYNIIMDEGYHTYYADGILVHNKSGLKDL